MLTVVNFAHGAFYMVGAYAAVALVGLGANFWVCLFFAPIGWDCSAWRWNGCSSARSTGGGSTTRCC